MMKFLLYVYTHTHTGQERCIDVLMEMTPKQIIKEIML